MYARQQGIGSYMIQQVFCNHKIEELYAETDIDAVNFYKKTGFAIKEFVEHYDSHSVLRYSCVLKN